MAGRKAPHKDRKKANQFVVEGRQHHLLDRRDSCGGPPTLEFLSYTPRSIPGQSTCPGFSPSNASESRKSRNLDFQSYIKHDTLQGSGFSTKLMRLDTLRAADVYLSPSEALNSSRSNRRLHRAVQTVGVVGLPPPQLPELHRAAQHLKRHWLLGFRGGGPPAAEKVLTRQPQSAK